MDLTEASQKWKELIARIEKLEEWSHPSKDLKDFCDFSELDERIKILEEKTYANDD